ncbi:MAG: hypothetical protein ISR59_13280 [Anaerolineales bacterium]|uniref:Uncharacterized protein n=1 Tax=Candidatus Desulfolinea nitratireducens TaxID=2841698 RepID=A0A8J6NJG7_9CHLR|nr:hypothetical protein [Candidatus Desulfolinea nitratireducens]MBL6962073.1 hypothetical protein [Anaerolineales bacterium]
MKKANERDEVNDEKHEPKEIDYRVMKDPYFYLMIFLWLLAFCSGVYAILVGAIVPY